MIFGDSDFPLKFFSEIGSVDHGRVFVDGVCEVFVRTHQHQLRSSQTDRAIERASSAYHHYFVLHARRIGQLPDFFIIGSSHACGGGSRHRTR